jgi:hypothetical protein
MAILFRPQGAFGWFSYTTSWDTIKSFQALADARAGQQRIRRCCELL